MNDQSTDYSGSETPSNVTPLRERDRSIERLRMFIAEAGFGPGDRIPPERELIERLGLTRNTLRRALDALEREGLIWRHVGKGTFISQGAEDTGGDETPGGMDLLHLARRTTPVKMMQARLTLEPAIAREAAMHASGETLDAIAAAAQACRGAADWSAYEAADDDFHRAIVRAADNLLLEALFDQLNTIRRSVTWRQVQRNNRRPGQDHTSFAEHDRILRAIRDRDAEGAQREMQAHLRSVAARLFGD